MVSFFKASTVVLGVILSSSLQQEGFVAAGADEVEGVLVAATIKVGNLRGKTNANSTDKMYNRIIQLSSKGLLHWLRWWCGFERTVR